MLLLLAAGVIFQQGKFTFIGTIYSNMKTPVGSDGALICGEMPVPADVLGAKFTPVKV